MQRCHSRLSSKQFECHLRPERLGGGFEGFLLVTPHGLDVRVLRYRIFSERFHVASAFALLAGDLGSLRDAIRSSSGKDVKKYDLLHLVRANASTEANSCPNELPTQVVLPVAGDLSAVQAIVNSPVHGANLTPMALVKPFSNDVSLGVQVVGNGASSLRLLVSVEFAEAGATLIPRQIAHIDLYRDNWVFTHRVVVFFSSDWAQATVSHSAFTSTQSPRQRHTTRISPEWLSPGKQLRFMLNLDRLHANTFYRIRASWCLSLSTTLCLATANRSALTHKAFSVRVSNEKTIYRLVFISLLVFLL